MKKDYLSKLERAARWRLPRQEAEDVIADYRDIIGTPPRPEEELYRELGRPRDAVKPLAAPRAYYTWLAVFAALTACILIPGLSPHAPFWRIWDKCFAGPFNGGWGRFGFSHWGPILAGIGLIGSLVWFRWRGWKEKRLPKAIPILLAVFLVFIGWVLWFCWACSQDFDGFCAMWGQTKIWFGHAAGKLTSASFYLSRIAMGNLAAPIALTGFFALIKARTGDRRWAAVYVLAMTAMLTALMVLSYIGSMALSKDFGLEDFFRWVLARCSIIAAVGVVSTGVALC